MPEFYAAKVSDRLNRAPWLPERITQRIMLNPHYPNVGAIEPCRYLVDSGAFQTMTARLSLSSAYDRQMRFVRSVMQRMEEAHGQAVAPQAIITYDQMAGVDECIVDGKPVKCRGTDETARQAVAETIRAARWWYQHRDEIDALGGTRIAYACQGISTLQYRDCAEAIASYMRDDDVFAFGGFCIIGRMPNRMMPQFEESAVAVLELLSSRIKRYHLLGVCYPPAVKMCAEFERRYGVQFSTDSSAIEQSSAKAGVRYVDGHQRKWYDVADKYQTWQPNALAHENVQAYHDWIMSL